MVGCATTVRRQRRLVQERIKSRAAGLVKGAAALVPDACRASLECGCLGTGRRGSAAQLDLIFQCDLLEIADKDFDAYLNRPTMIRVGRFPNQRPRRRRDAFHSQ
jgi:hypothetical protein